MGHPGYGLTSTPFWLFEPLVCFHKNERKVTEWEAGEKWKREIDESKEYQEKEES